MDSSRKELLSNLAAAREEREEQAAETNNAPRRRKPFGIPIIFWIVVPVMLAIGIGFYLRSVGQANANLQATPAIVNPGLPPIEIQMAEPNSLNWPVVRVLPTLQSLETPRGQNGAVEPCYYLMVRRNGELWYYRELKPTQLKVGAELDLMMPLEKADPKKDTFSVSVENPVEARSYQMVRLSNSIEFDPLQPGLLAQPAPPRERSKKIRHITLDWQRSGRRVRIGKKVIESPVSMEKLARILGPPTRKEVVESWGEIYIWDHDGITLDREGISIWFDTRRGIDRPQKLFLGTVSFDRDERSHVEALVEVAVKTTWKELFPKLGLKNFDADQDSYPFGNFGEVTKSYNGHVERVIIRYY